MNNNNKKKNLQEDCGSEVVGGTCGGCKQTIYGGEAKGEVELG